MGILGRALERKASVSDMEHPEAWLVNWTSGNVTTTSGQNVSPSTASNLGTYFACMRNIAEDVGKMPCIVYERQEPQGKRRATDHPLYDLLHDEPNTTMTSTGFYETLTSWAFGWGNGYAEISRNGLGQPTGLWPIHPSRVQIKQSGQVVQYVVKMTNVQGNALAQDVTLDAANVLHVRGLSDDGLTGYSIAQLGAQTIGLGLAAEKFAGAYFGNSAIFGAVLKHPKTMSDKAYARWKQRLEERHTGSEKAFKTMILEDGLELSEHRLGIPPRDSQMLETIENNVEQIARWSRMPLSKIQYHKRAQGWSTLEALNTDYVVDTLTPWLVRWEREIKRKLFTREERQRFFAEFLVASLLRGDMAARSSFYREMLNIGAMSPDEIRAEENMAPVPGGAGAKFFMQSNMSTLDRIAEPPPPPPQLVGGMPMGEPDEGDEDTDGGGDDGEARPREARADDFRPALRASVERVARKARLASAGAGRKLGRDPDRLAAWAQAFRQDVASDLVDAAGPVLVSARLALGMTVEDGSLADLAHDVAGHLLKLPPEQMTEILVVEDVVDKLAGLLVAQGG